MDIRDLARGLEPVLHRLRAADDAVIEDQVAITRIPAPTGAESARGLWMTQRFAAAGLRNVHTDDAGNVLATGGPDNGAAPIVLCAHLDTVFESREPIEVRRQGVRLEAPGISDNARGLATVLALAGEVASGALPTARPVLFVATTGEEGPGDLRGARHLFDTAGRAAHAAIAVDGPGDERIVHLALGSRRYHVSFHGAGGHSWGAYGAPNAVHAAAAFVTRVAALAPGGRDQAAITAARIAGGRTINAIPADAWIEVDVRSSHTGELDRIDEELRAAAFAAAESQNAGRRAGSAPMAVDVTVIGDRPAGRVPADAAIVSTAVEATRFIGRTPELAVASTDANIPISRGIPAISIGGGGAGGDTHTPAEWFENRDGASGVARAVLILAAIAAAG